MPTHNDDNGDEGLYVGRKIMHAQVEEEASAEDIALLKPIEGMSDQEFADLASSILVVIPHRATEGINPGIATHFGMWGRICMPVCFVKDPHGGFIEVTRGGIVQAFLEHAWKNPQIRYLVMIDNDQAIAWDAPLKLAYHGKPIVSGVVCGYNPERGIFACFTAKDDNGVARFPSWRDTKSIPAEGLIEAEQVGTGLICIRRDVLETIRDNGEEPFFIPEEDRKASVGKGQLGKSEDIVFCERAARYGFKRYVDFSVHATHYKTIGIGWPADCIDNTIDAIDWKPSAFDYRGVM